MTMRGREIARRRRQVGEAGLQKALARPSSGRFRDVKSLVPSRQTLSIAKALSVKPTISRGVVTSPGKAIAVRLLGRVIGGSRAAQFQAIARQQLARVPLAAKVAGGAVGATALSEALTGQSPIPLGRELLLRTGKGFGKRTGSPGQVATRRESMPRQLAVGEELPPAHVVVRTWQTFPGGPVFARLADGHIAVRKKDGTIKHYRPYRPVCIPKKFDAKAMRRVATALKRQRKAATAVMKLTGGMPKR